MGKAYTASKFRELVTIQSPLGERDITGDYVVEDDIEDGDWLLFAQAWAEVVATGGSEQQQGERMDSTTNYKITIRYLPGVESGMRIVKGSQTWHISAVLPDVQKREIVLECVEAHATN